MGETITPHNPKNLRNYLKIFQEISVGHAEELGRGVARARDRTRRQGGANAQEVVTPLTGPASLAVSGP